MIPPELDGARVDKALATLLDLSRSDAVVLVDRGVTVDGSPVKAADRVVGGARLVSPRSQGHTGLEPEPVDFGVPFEDEDLVVVDKPAGIVVHPGSGRAKGTLAAGLLHQYPEIEGVGPAERWGLVHRLDKDTSGLLLVGRTNAAYEKLTEMLANREITRDYTALASGVFSSATGTIDAPISRDPARPTRRAVRRGGKPARTHYEVEETFPDWDCTLLRVRLETGRTHQIRVHLAAIDHPVIGDKTYGERTTKATAPRTFLHASHIEFTHPRTGEQMVVDSPLPPDLQEVLDGLV